MQTEHLVKQQINVTYTCCFHQFFNFCS